MQAPLSHIHLGSPKLGARKPATTKEGMNMKNQNSDIISVENLVEVYSDGTKALDGISFEVQEGEFFGFLGPNGAGKSTAIKVLTTLLKKTSGQVSVAGYDLDKSSKEIRKLIGKSQEKGLTLVPLRVYLQRGKFKVELGVARGKKIYDKRETERRKEADREAQAAMRRRR